MTENQKQPAAKSPKENRGVPLWMPLAALVVAFACMILVGVRVVPALSALLFPPAPPLPDGVTATPILHENKGWGLDEYVYVSDQDGCKLAKYYLSRLGNCLFDPSINCAGGGIAKTGAPVTLVHCSGQDVIGTYTVNWTAYVGDGYDDPSQPGRSRIRVIREIGSN